MRRVYLSEVEYKIVRKFINDAAIRYEQDPNNLIDNESVNEYTILDKFLNRFFKAKKLTLRYDMTKTPKWEELHG